MQSTCGSEQAPNGATMQIRTKALLCAYVVRTEGMEAPALLGFDTQDIQACLGVGKNKTEGNSSGQKAVGHVKKELSGAGTVVEVDQTRDTHLEELLRELRRCIAHKHVYVLAFAFHAIPQTVPHVRMLCFLFLLHCPG